jgi:hypothetical protein
VIRSSPALQDGFEQEITELTENGRNGSLLSPLSLLPALRSPIPAPVHAIKACKEFASRLTDPFLPFSPQFIRPIRPRMPSSGLNLNPNLNLNQSL